MALTGFINDTYSLAALSYEDKRVNGGSVGTMPGYVTADDLNQIKAAVALNNDALSQYSEDIHATIDDLRQTVQNTKEVITDPEQVSIQSRIEALQRGLKVL